MDRRFARDFSSNTQDNDPLYKNLSVDSTELIDFLSLKILVDSLELNIDKEIVFLDSLDSNYALLTIVKGDKEIISDFYKGGVKEKEILYLLQRIDTKLTMLSEDYDQTKFNFLPTDTLLMYDKMPLELLKGLFQITISTVRDAEKEALLRKLKKQT